MAKLSVNINKIATLRNARGGALPNVLQVAKDCERFGAEGITVHPRPDERHITTNDVYDLASALEVEFNIEGFPDERFMKMMRELKPAQATLVPDTPEQITSDNGWDTVQRFEFLKPIVEEIQGLGIRCSLFVDPDIAMIEGGKRLGVDRVELYTGPFAESFHADKHQAVQAYTVASQKAKELNIGLNAGHDLNLHNLAFFNQSVEDLLEVSIGHALVCDALYLGLENTIQQYKRQLK